MMPFSYQQDNMLIESHSNVLQIPLQSSPARLSHPLCPAEKTSYHRGNLTFWGIGVIWIGRSAVITWIWPVSCMKQHKLKVSAVTSSTFHLHSFHFRLKFSSEQPQLKYLVAENGTSLSNRNSVYIHLNCSGNLLVKRGQVYIWV